MSSTLTIAGSASLTVNGATFKLASANIRKLAEAMQNIGAVAAATAKTMEVLLTSHGMAVSRPTPEEIRARKVQRKLTGSACGAVTLPVS